MAVFWGNETQLLSLGNFLPGFFRNLRGEFVRKIMGYPSKLLNIQLERMNG
jgi:hypothetical protein